MNSRYITVYAPPEDSPAWKIGKFGIKVTDLDFIKGYANDRGYINFDVLKAKAPYNEAPYAGITLQIQEPYKDKQTNRKPESAPQDERIENIDEEIPF